MNPFDCLYSNKDPRAFSQWGVFYRPPALFEHGRDYLVAELEKMPLDGDGRKVRVYETRLPARFYRIVAGPGVNSVGDPQAGFEFSTGSGCEELVVQLVDAIRSGMLVLRGGQ